MRNKFWLDGKCSEDYGLVITAKNPYAAPQRITETVRPLGGSVLISDDYGYYDSITRQYEIGLAEELSPRTQLIREWLLAMENFEGKPYRTLIDTYNIHHYQRVYAVQGVHTLIQAINRVGTGTLDFVCDGYRYLRKGKEPVNFRDSSFSLYNPTKTDALPIITLYSGAGSRGGNLTVNGVDIQTATAYHDAVFNFENLTITDESGNSLMRDIILSGGDALEKIVLKPGENTISASHSCEIIRNWREI